jgi:hypothetical protein
MGISLFLSLALSSVNHFVASGQRTTANC